MPDDDPLAPPRVEADPYGVRRLDDDHYGSRRLDSNPYAAPEADDPPPPPGKRANEEFEPTAWTRLLAVPIGFLAFLAAGVAVFGFVDEMSAQDIDQDAVFAMLATASGAYFWTRASNRLWRGNTRVGWLVVAPILIFVGAAAGLGIIEGALGIE